MSEHTLHGRKIVTHLQLLLAPDRTHDWQAVFESDTRGLFGEGATEEEAIEALLLEDAEFNDVEFTSRDHAKACIHCALDAIASVEVRDATTYESKGFCIGCFECGNRGPVRKDTHIAVAAWNAQLSPFISFTTDDDGEDGADG